MWLFRGILFSQTKVLTCLQKDGSFDEGVLINQRGCKRHFSIFPHMPPADLPSLFCHRPPAFTVDFFSRVWKVNDGALVLHEVKQSCKLMTLIDFSRWKAGLVGRMNSPFRPCNQGKKKFRLLHLVSKRLISFYRGDLNKKTSSTAAESQSGRKLIKVTL